MTRVFVGGSRRVSRLNDRIRSRLAELVRRDMQIVVGDANGADRAIQRQLAAWRYENVTVFFVGKHPRNNEGAWPTRLVATDARPRGFEYYAAKDKEMADVAECGLMLWDGESRGTLQNVRRLVQHGKPVSLYLSPAKTFLNVTTESDLLALPPESVPVNAHTSSATSSTHSKEDLDLFGESIPPGRRSGRRSA